MNPDELAIRQLHDEVIAAFNTCDLEKLLALHTEDITVVETDQPALVGKSEVRPAFTQTFDFLKSSKTVSHHTFHIDELEVAGKRAFAHEQVITITQNPDGTPHEEVGEYLCMFKKQGDGRWLRSLVMANNDTSSKRKEFWKN